MIAIYNFIPLYCPSCGTLTRLERADNPISGKFKAHQTLDCEICGVTYQLAGQSDILRAATASGGDMLEHFMDEDDLPGGWKQN